MINSSCTMSSCQIASTAHACLPQICCENLFSCKENQHRNTRLVIHNKICMKGLIKAIFSELRTVTKKKVHCDK